MPSLDLRPLSLGELLDRTFFLYRRHFLLFTGIAAIPYSLFFVINLGSTLLARFRFGGPGFPVSGQIPTPSSGIALASGGILAVVLGSVGFAALLFSIGASVFAVSDIYTGQPTSIRASLRQVRQHVITILGVLFLCWVIVIGGLILLIVPGIYFGCRLSVATVAALVEDIGASDAIRRSFALTKNFAGRAFLIILLTLMIAVGVVGVLQFPLGILIAVYAKQPQFVTMFLILAQAGNFLGNVLVMPVGTIGIALFYYDLRVRKEAFDLQLMLQAIGGAPVRATISGGEPSKFGRDAS